jgi:mannose-6-phosphate isomerase-like protein (cupin superfamily)
MIRAGDSIYNRVTGVRITVCKTQEQTNGNGFQVEYIIDADRKGLDVNTVWPHLHMWWTEQFEILSGSGRYYLDGVEYAVQAGDVITFPPKRPQRHPWNTGKTKLHMRQTDSFAHPDPKAVKDTLSVFATLYGLANDGRTDRRGLPNPLQLSVILEKLEEYGGFLEGPPIFMQRTTVGKLATLARLMGYKAIYRRYNNN